ncbi:transposase [Mesorhizobium sp. M1148]|uniref:transposase n=1 Tax=unclassified Mesorhizobium TaxID=325217 RepID=UPI003334D815
MRRFCEPQKLVSYFGLNPRVRQSGLGIAQYGRISKHGRSHARATPVEAAWAAAKAPGPLRLSSCASATSVVIRSQPWRSPASSPC